MPATLLVELLTEELPPKALRGLSDAFAVHLGSSLQRAGFTAHGASARALATPRRLAATIASVLERSPDSQKDVLGPPASAPQQAVAGFAKKSGVPVDALKKQSTPKGEVYV